MRASVATLNERGNREMAPSRNALRLVFSTAATLAFLTVIAAAQQDPFRQSRELGGNSNGATQQPGGNSERTAQEPGVSSGGTAAGDSSDAKNSATKKDAKTKAEPEFVIKSEAEWRRILTREQYMVTRLKATEPAFTGKYAQGHFRGTFLCVCCGAELFDAETKFESGTGWPSFWRPINERAVTYQVDNSDLEVRTEVNCRRCGAHLGHVFNDGPPPTGLRFCMNSIALKLRPPAGASEGRMATSRSRVRTKAKPKTTKSKAKSTSQSAKSKGSASPATQPPTNRKAADKPDQPPSAGSERS